MQQVNEQLAAEVLSFVQDRLTMLIPAIYTPLQACTMEQGLLCGTSRLNDTL